MSTSTPTSFRPKRVAAVCRRLRDDGVAGILATVITADLDAMCRRLANICRVRDADPAIAGDDLGHSHRRPVSQRAAGLHRRPSGRIRPAGRRRYDEAAARRRRRTDEDRHARARARRKRASDQISRGAGRSRLGRALQSDARRTAGSIDAGLSLFTHLGNGCPGMLPRHDNIIQRVLSLSDRLIFGFIADGVHVPFVALGNYLKCCGLDRAFIVTDAICGAGLGPGEYTIGSRRVVVDENLATWSADRSHLMGSAGTMRRSEENLRRALGLDEPQIAQLMTANPRKILGMT